MAITIEGIQQQLHGELDRHQPASRRWLPALEARLLRVYRRMRRWQSLARQRRELAGLSDETLRDIGLSRVDALREARRPFWDDAGYPR